MRIDKSRACITEMLHAEIKFQRTRDDDHSGTIKIIDVGHPNKQKHRYVSDYTNTKCLRRQLSGIALLAISEFRTVQCRTCWEALPCSRSRCLASRSWCPAGENRCLANNSLCPATRSSCLARKSQSLPGEKKQRPGEQKSMPAEQQSMPGEQKSMPSKHKSMPGKQK